MDAEILRALRAVIDPELGIDIVSLGLIYAAERDGEQAKVTMTMTTPACPMGSMLVEDARTAIETTVPGVRTAEVNLTFDPPWSPSMLSPEARAQLGHPEP